jgi:diaminohydroxyphosphoribosylaminopyrimidine deaminase/5-amino-6-(5-phosphoribosylamino)uracil reductase
VASQAELEAMRRAITLAARGAGRTSPNPVVGCVVLDRHGAVAGEGWHARAGGPHAEIEALRAAGEAARGGTAVVTLEPCNHTGRTGPCAQALIAAGVARVVVAVDDPNPVAAGGAATLRAAGVEVESGLLTAEAAAGNVAWLTALRTGRPHLTWKFAATLDGRSAAADGTSRWITGPAARADVHRLRAGVDTILAGIGTVLTDDPELTVRLPGHDGHQPLRVVVDSTGRTPAHARVRDGAAATWIATAAEVGADPDGHVDLAKLLAALHARGSRSVLLEGGPTLAGAALRAGLVDRVVGYLAPALLGAGPAALAEAGITTIDRALRLDVTDVALVGTDVRITATPRSTTAPQED